MNQIINNLHFNPKQKKFFFKKNKHWHYVPFWVAREYMEKYNMSTDLQELVYGNL